MSINTPTQREHRKWWAITDSDVVQVTGYSCGPTNPDMWWCPKVGFSGAEGCHLFETEGEAIDRLIANLTHRIDEARANIEALQLRKKDK